MTNVLMFILFVIVGIAGIFAGATVFKPKPKVDGELIIVKDPVDGEVYTALGMRSLAAMENLKTGDVVCLKVAVRQENSFYNG